jgi:hypothetical protein
MLEYIYTTSQKILIGVALACCMVYAAQAQKITSNDSLKLKKGRSPKVAALRAAVFPGWGQIYNQKYWKLPLVYGGAAAIGYGVYWNNSYYQYYRNIYQEAFLTNNPLGINLERAALLRNEYRRKKEQLIIFGVLFYGLTVVDAIVDAHFSTYDVGDDLTLKVYPKIDFSPQGQTYFAATIQLGIKNKKTQKSFNP